MQTCNIDTVMCDDHPITVQKNVKYLGVWIDDKLDFTEHIQRVTQKISWCCMQVKTIFPPKYLHATLPRSHTSISLPYA